MANVPVQRHGQVPRLLVYLSNIVTFDEVIRVEKGVCIVSVGMAGQNSNTVQDACAHVRSTLTPGS